MIWQAASGRGVVHTYTVVRQSTDTYFREHLPYVVAMIDLDEGVRIMSNVIGCDPQSVTIGMRVQCTCERLDENIGVPVFTPQTHAG